MTCRQYSYRDIYLTPDGPKPSSWESDFIVCVFINPTSMSADAVVSSLSMFPCRHEQAKAAPLSYTSIVPKRPNKQHQCQASAQTMSSECLIQNRSFNPVLSHPSHHHHLGLHVHHHLYSFLLLHRPVP